MNADLIKQFIEQELNDEVRGVLWTALAQRSPSKVLDRFDFNRFEVVIDYENALVRIADDLDVSSAGTAEIPLEQLRRLVE